LVYIYNQKHPTYNPSQVKSIPRETIHENFKRKRIDGFVSAYNNNNNTASKSTKEIFAFTRDCGAVLFEIII